MPRLDAERVDTWRNFARLSGLVRRAVDTMVQERTGLTLAQFEVLALLARHDGPMRVHEVAEALGELDSTLSRRLDRMEEDGYVERVADTSNGDKRAVWLTLLKPGRVAWRLGLVDYRRAVQQHFATVLTESDLVALTRIFAKLPVNGEPGPPRRSG